MGKGIYIGAPNFQLRQLPAGYTQLEYIESSGTQCINTGVNPNQNIGFTIDVQVLNTQTSDGSIIAVRNLDTGIYQTLYLSGSAQRFRSRYGTQSALQFSEEIPATGRNVFIKTGNTLSTGGETLTFTNETFQMNEPLTLFCINTGGTFSQFCKMRLFSCKIYNGNTLIRDFVPCKNVSGAVGLYDIASGSFYANVGTGVFIAGQGYQEVARKVKKMYVGVGVTHEDSKIVAYPVDETTLPVGAGVGADSPPFWNSSSSAYEFPNNVITERYSNPYYCVEIVGSAAKYYIPDADKTTYYTFNTAKRIAMKKFTSINSIARKVKKAYIGVGGVARPCFSDSVISYYGTATELSKAGTPYSAYFNDKAVFVVGNTATFYNENLVKSTLSLNNYCNALAYNSEYLLIGNGTFTNYVDPINKNLVTSTRLSMYEAYNKMGGSIIPNYGVFAGGETPDSDTGQASGSPSNDICIFSTNLTKTTRTYSGGCYGGSILSSDKYALIGPGSQWSGNAKYNPTAISSSLTITNCVDDHGRINYAVGRAGTKGLFAGGYQHGYGSYIRLDIVNAFDLTNLTKTGTSPLSKPTRNLSGTYSDNISLIGGGDTNESDASPLVTGYDKNLTKIDVEQLQAARYRLAGNKVGKYHLFAGGNDINNSSKNIVEVYME